jgi:Alpha-L-fucosidase/F5/8 type C domain/Carbohydrate binding module (family 35)/NPCBM-associated, NEW3 domain of alpha-galactosidase
MSRRARFSRRPAIALATLGVAAGLLASSAQAELYHPRQDWLRDSTAGLFLHWGMFTSPIHTDCAEWEQAVTDGGWDPRYWVREAQKLRASYLVLTTFHSRLGYARPWPSKIPGSCATGRDILGETIAAAKAEGLHVLLYMTDDPQWHDERGVESFDSAAYSAYKGHPVDLTTRDGFGEYSYDLFFEVMQRYPDLGGFWIDNDNAYWEQHHLYEQIREIRPHYLLSNNNEDTPIMDTVSNEQKTGMTPDYDYPAALWTPLPRLTEADYKLPTTGSWWYDGEDHEVDTGLSVGRYITNAGSSVKSLMAETAMVDGRFPPQQEAFNDFMADYLPPIWESIDDTEGGGYMYGGMQPGAFNDGAYGVITLKNGRDRRQYVHVTTPPQSQDHVRIRDNGYRVKRVTNVRTGERMRFNQSGGRLTILGVDEWDPYDTVFEVATGKRRGYYEQERIDSTASASAEDHDGAALTDGSYLDYWDNGGAMPVSFTLDLGRRKPVSFLALNQREWSPTYNRETFGRQEDSARIKDYRVHVSDDGEDWGEPVKSGRLESARGVRFIDFGPHKARYVRLEILSNWSDPALSTYFNQVRVDEVYAGHRYVNRRGNPLPGEAEARSSRLTGAARRERCDACSGGAQVSGLGGGAVTIRDVEAEEAGDHRLDVHFTAAGEGTLAVAVNGRDPIELPVSGQSTAVPELTSVAVPLRAGANKVTLWGAGRLGVDRIAIGEAPPADYEPKADFDVVPSDIWVAPGSRSIDVSATFELEDVYPIDGVSLAPAAPAGWTVDGAPATAERMQPGEVLAGDWTLLTPAGNAADAAVPVRVTFRMLGRSYARDELVQVHVLPPGWAFFGEGESTANTFSGRAGVGGCELCSGGEKVRFIGGDPDNHLTFNGVEVDAAGEYTLQIDSTVNGSRSFFVSVNGGPGAEVTVTGTSWDVPTTTTTTVTLQAGENTIRFFNDDGNAPDLDRIRIADPGP